MPIFQTIECNGWPGVIAWVTVAAVLALAFDVRMPGVRPRPRSVLKGVALSVFAYYVFWYWGR